MPSTTTATTAQARRQFLLETLEGIKTATVKRKIEPTNSTRPAHGVPWYTTLTNHISLAGKIPLFA
jgi:hypothetical protein